MIPRGAEIAPRKTRLSIARYLDAEEFVAEQRALFRRTPTVVAHASELAEAGACVARRVADVPIVLVNDAGRVRGFLNACRHRGAELLRPGEACTRKALVCPDHAWSYRLDGSLLHVPDEQSFDGIARERMGLVELACELRHGLVWICPEGPLNLERFLGPALDADLSGFALSEHRLEATREHHVQANWKLVMDAFAEGYHVRSLHRQSLSRFFLEAALIDDLDPHVRQVGARRSFPEAAAPTIRDDTTAFYNLFPNSIVVFHPLWISWATLQPESVDRARVVHRMLVHPAVQDKDKLRRSFALIDAQVFSKEDLAMAESIQRTLRSGANEHVLVGAREEGMRLFHRNRDRALAAQLRVSR